MDVMTQDINLFGMKFKELEAILRSEEASQDKRGAWVDGGGVAACGARDAGDDIAGNDGCVGIDERQASGRGERRKIDRDGEVAGDGDCLGGDVEGGGVVEEEDGLAVQGVEGRGVGDGVGARCLDGGDGVGIGGAVYGEGG